MPVLGYTTSLLHQAIVPKTEPWIKYCAGLIALYEDYNKPEEAKKVRAKLPQTEAQEE